MIIYAVTVHIEHESEQEWISWMREVHIPDVLKTGLFLGCSFLKAEVQGIEGYKTWCFQYRLESMEKLRNYEQNYAPEIKADHTRRYEGKFKASRVVYIVEGEVKS